MGYERIYIIFLCINLTLMLGGFSVVGEADIFTPANSTIVAGSTTTGGVGELVNQIGKIPAVAVHIISFFFGGGIMGLLVASGFPTILQLLVALPLAMIAIFGLFQLVATLVGLIPGLK